MSYEESVETARAVALWKGPRSPGWFAKCIEDSDVPVVSVSYWQEDYPGSLSGEMVTVPLKLEGLYHALDALEQRVAALEAT